MDCLICSKAESSLTTSKEQLGTFKQFCEILNLEFTDLFSEPSSFNVKLRFFCLECFNELSNISNDILEMQKLEKKIEEFKVKLQRDVLSSCEKLYSLEKESSGEKSTIQGIRSRIYNDLTQSQIITNDNSENSITETRNFNGEFNYDETNYEESYKEIHNYKNLSEQSDNDKRIEYNENDEEIEQNSFNRSFSSTSLNSSFISSRVKQLQQIQSYSPFPLENEEMPICFIKSEPDEVSNHSNSSYETMTNSSSAPILVFKKRKKNILDNDKLKEEAMRNKVTIKLENLPESTVRELGKRGRIAQLQIGETPEDPFESQYCLKEFQCIFCGEMLKNYKTLNIHMRLHTKEKPFRCNKCSKVYSDSASLTHHSRTHIQDKSYITKFTKYGNWNSGTKLFKCETCSKIVKKQSRRDHRKVHDKSLCFKCKFCERYFRRKFTLDNHMRKIHTDNYGPEKSENMKPHMSTPLQANQAPSRIYSKIKKKDEICICETCGKAIKYIYLKDHIRTHTGEKPFKCGICERAFNRKSILRIHRTIHTGEKPFMCSECGKTFPNKPCLNQHLLIHSDEKKFECKICGKSFAQKRRLVHHEVLHSGVKAFKCTLCDKSFFYSRSLKSHIRTHK